MSDLDAVTRIELTPVNVPFKAIVRQAMLAGAGGLGMAIPSDEPWLGGDFVICRLETGNGTTGLGEAYIWLPETGQTTGQIIDVIKVALHRYVIGENPGNFKKIKARMDVNVARNEVAKGLLDIALYDLVGKLTNKPVHEIIGGKRCETLPLAALVPLGKLESMVEYALVFKEMGYKTLRVKLGTSIQDDATIMAAIRDAVGPKIRLRVDYNQAYAVPDAITAIQAIEPFDIDVAEQPVAMDDYLGMKTVQERVKTPLMAHEGCFTFKDFVILAHIGAVRVLGLNSERPGGMTAALDCIKYAHGLGFGTVIHNQPLGIASAMLAHLACVTWDVLGHDVELFGDMMWEDDLIKKPLPCKRGRMIVPSEAGYGVALDEDALQKYATSPTIEIE